MTPAHQPRAALANPPAVDEAPVSGPIVQQQDTDVHSDVISRRSALGTAVAGTVIVAAGGVVAACGTSNSSSGTTTTTSTNGNTSTNPASPSSGSKPGSPGGPVLAATSDIPVAGGKIFPAQKVVVTQPVAGTFKGFSSTCTHQGCQLNKVAAGLIECPCHGSRYSVTDGSVQAGPASKPLPPANITVNGSDIILNS